jgi:hypothetical protein
MMDLSLTSGTEYGSLNLITTAFFLTSNFGTILRSVFIFSSTKLVRYFDHFCPIVCNKVIVLCLALFLISRCANPPNLHNNDRCTRYVSTTTPQLGLRRCSTL